MSKTISVGLAADLALGVTTLANCWMLTRKDGTSFYFTDCDIPIVYDGNTYLASTGYSRTNIELNKDLDVGNLEVHGLLDSSYIKETDLRARLYDNCQVWTFIIDYENVANGPIRTPRGFIGQTKIIEESYILELRDLNDALREPVLRYIVPTCSHVFGGTRCGVDKSLLKQSGTVDNASSKKVFTTSGMTHSSDNEFKYGIVTFTSGDNADLSMEIKSSVQSTASIELYLNLPFTISSGDAFDIWPGCEQTVDACKAYNNIENFGGFHFVPNTDDVLKGALDASAT